MFNRTQLVCQHLERASRSVLEEYQAEIKDYVRGRHGIYALYRNDKLYYVGLASNLRARLKQHLRDRHSAAWNHFSIYLTIEAGHIKELESLVLRITRPRGNRSGGRFKRSENLERALKRDVKARQYRELEALFRRTRPAHIEPSRTMRRVARDGHRVTLAPYIKRAFTIRARYKNDLVRARVLRNGAIRLRGMRYDSPSDAAERITNRPVNGWTFWKYQRVQGVWVPLADLRKR